MELYRFGVDSIGDCPMSILRKSKKMEKISIELRQLNILPNTIDIIINYLGLFNNNARQKDSVESELHLKSVEKNIQSLNHS